MDVPTSLRRWFVAHFVADAAGAISLFFAPELTLRAFGWHTVDPIATRVVAAALFGIGLESFLGRNGGRDEYLAILNLKIIWSLAAIAGFVLALLLGAPFGVWLFGAVFAFFSGLWIYYRVRLGRAPVQA
jgi:hypothetical protein